MCFVLKDHIVVRKFIGKRSLKPPRFLETQAPHPHLKTAIPIFSRDSPTAGKKEIFYSDGGRGTHLHHLQKQVVAYSLCSAADGA